MASLGDHDVNATEWVAIFFILQGPNKGGWIRSCRGSQQDALEYVESARREIERREWIQYAVVHESELPVFGLSSKRP
jgi:hypothetical protein